MKIQSRSAVGLPPVPGSVGHRRLSSWTGIKVHHTGGSFSSWRSIFDWQVHNRPAAQRLVDVGYSFGIGNGRVTELRGFGHHPAHDHENSTLGVVFGGNFTSRLPPDEDLDVFVEFVRHAREHTGRPLPVTGHRDTWPRGDGRYSTCPGDQLYGYLPQLRRRIDDEEDDMPITDEDAVKIRREVLGSLQHLSIEVFHKGRKADGSWPTERLDTLLARIRARDEMALRLIKAQQPLLEAAAKGVTLSADEVARVAAASAEAVAEAVPDELADEVVNELGDRLSTDSA